MHLSEKENMGHDLEKNLLPSCDIYGDIYMTSFKGAPWGDFIKAFFSSPFSVHKQQGDTQSIQIWKYGFILIMR